MSRGRQWTERPLQAPDAFDAATRLIIRGELERHGDRLTFRLPDRMESPNEWQGANRMVKHRITKRWEARMRRLIADAAGRTSISEFAWPVEALGLARCVKRRMAVAIERHAPSARNFCRDDDNIHFLSKPINDALKRMGLIFEDSTRWIDRARPVQRVSADGRWWAVITVEPEQTTLSADPARTASE